MKNGVERGRFLIVGILIFISSASQASISTSNGEEWTSNNRLDNKVSYQNPTKVMRYRIIKADDLKFFRTYVDNRFCGIEITNPNGSYDLVLKDDNGTVCARYNSEIVSGVDMDEVRDSTLPLFRKSEFINDESIEQPEALIRVSDIIRLVQQNAVGGEKIKLHPMNTKSDGLENYPTAQRNRRKGLEKLRCNVSIDNSEVFSA